MIFDADKDVKDVSRLPPEIPLDDPEFAEVAARWGELSETVRQAILEAIRKARRQEAEQNGGDVDEK
ncbi:MAG: hypothetical protein AMXMBFR13_16680 [Phycisphaerae bacterium]